MKNEKARKLADRITEAAFYFDPYNGADEEEMTKYNRSTLKTLSGCYEIIDALCSMILES